MVTAPLVFAVGLRTIERAGRGRASAKRLALLFALFAGSPS
jgi:hypothetical protein